MIALDDPDTCEDVATELLSLAEDVVTGLAGVLEVAGIDVDEV